MKKTKKSELVILIILIGFLVYLPSLFGGFIWDDEDFVYQNKYVAQFEVNKIFTQDVIAGRGKVSNYYRPIQLSLYSTIHSFFDFTPFFFHALNIIIHIMAALAIFFFFLEIVKNQLFSFLISLVFIIHPVQTEAVSYISGLSDPLFVFFGFLSLIFFLKKKNLNKYYWFSLMAFAFSLLSKETGLAFFGLLFLVWFFWRRKDNLILLFPYLLIALGYLVFHFEYINRLDMRTVWGNSLYGQSLLVRLSTFIKNIFSYVGLLIFPKNLFMERDMIVQIETHLINPYLFIFIIINLIILAFIWYLYRKNKKNKFLLFSYLGFYLSLLPVSGIVLINGIFYEHFLYLPLVFFFSFCIYFFVNKKNKIVFILLSILLIIFSFRSVVRQFDWINPIRFYKQTLQYAPNSVRVRNNLGMEYASQGEIDEAIKEYKKALTIDSTVSNLHHNLANAYLKKGLDKKAEKEYLKAIELNPAFIFSYQSLYNLYQKQGRKKQAEKLKEKYEKENFK